MKQSLNSLSKEMTINHANVGHALAPSPSQHLKVQNSRQLNKVSSTNQLHVHKNTSHKRANGTAAQGLSKEAKASPYAKRDKPIISEPSSQFGTKQGTAAANYPANFQSHRTMQLSSTEAQPQAETSPV